MAAKLIIQNRTCCHSERNAAESRNLLFPGNRRFIDCARNDGFRNQSGFTLIEILVVVAITVLLFALLFTPMIASFNLTSEARARIEAQDAGRGNLMRISREIADGLFVYDNSQPLEVPSPGGYFVQIPYAKLDIMMPRMLMHCNNESGPLPKHPDAEPRDYARDNPLWPANLEEAWPTCPVCGSNNVEARPIQPLTASSLIVRYFVGLKDPSQPYVNGYDGLSDVPSDNMYVLYRAEFSPSDVNLVKQDADGTALLNDPKFFYDQTEAPNGQTYSANWKRISRIVGPSKDVNLIHFYPLYGKTGPWAGISSVRFEPTAIQNDALTPTFLTDTDAEMPVAIPTIFRSAHGNWVFSPPYRVIVHRNDFNVAYFTDVDTSDPARPIWLFRYNSGGSTPIFNISRYTKTGDLSYLTSPGPELMLWCDEKQGEVRFAFPMADTPVLVEDINATPDKSYKLAITNTVANALIVPGSEDVIGPDETPGAQSDNANDPVRYVHYTRVPLALGTPGINQYRIDYDTGDVWFPSGSKAMTEVLPGNRECSVRISYKFHNNQNGDIVKADYTTKALLTIAFGMRIYDHQSGKLQKMELTNRVRVRNLVR